MRFFSDNLHKKSCSICGNSSSEISSKLGICKKCILERSKESLEKISLSRRNYRKEFSLPLEPPKTKNGLLCGDCVNNCILGIKEVGFCNLVKNIDGKITRLAGDEKKGGLFSFYYDPLPTNCVAEPFCPGCTSTGYPKFSYVDGPEIGWNNLAVFYQSCTFDCLFCQNYQYRKGIHLAKPSPPQILIDALKKNTSCICFFGGDPASQIRHSNAVGELALIKAEKEDRIIRVCWETNGSARPSLMKRSIEIAMKSGGSIKIDFKAFDDVLNIALCGSSNKFTIRNIKTIGKMVGERPEVPLLVISTLLIPGYIEVDQVEKISKLIADINPTIPYSLLAFYPTFVIDDLPTTSLKQAEECFKVAKEQGLIHVNIGNKHLLR
ncbi:MAG: radical SAM protein [Candidatus Heimdallarchaeota archaeon]|nr:radical SAM protein [Candidatus Heimdallarchaeota archaeon]